MSNFTTKPLCLVGRVGPAFSVNEIPAAHEALDHAGAPRCLQGRALTLPERIQYLSLHLKEARARANRKTIVILSKSESESLIPKEYRVLEVKA